MSAASSSSTLNEIPFASYWMANPVKNEAVNAGAEAEAAAKAEAEAEVKELIAEAETEKEHGVTTVTGSYVRAVAANPYVAKSDMFVKETKVSARPMSFLSRVRARLGRFLKRQK